MQQREELMNKDQHRDNTTDDKQGQLLIRGIKYCTVAKYRPASHTPNLVLPGTSMSFTWETNICHLLSSFFFSLPILYVPCTVLIALLVLSCLCFNLLPTSIFLCQAGLGCLFHTPGTFHPSLPGCAALPTDLSLVPGAF